MFQKFVTILFGLKEMQKALKVKLQYILTMICSHRDGTRELLASVKRRVVQGSVLTGFTCTEKMKLEGYSVMLQETMKRSETGAITAAGFLTKEILVKINGNYRMKGLLLSDNMYLVSWKGDYCSMQLGDNLHYATTIVKFNGGIVIPTVGISVKFQAVKHMGGKYYGWDSKGSFISGGDETGGSKSETGGQKLGG
ncbi:hypothetical protein F2Q68_00016992 [Brassica cretica]|uniref:Uncharacterized protein n=1 Tax=Brassica cretica TaxID=69181 RepID=A0A8S9HJM3_BRACR|nr:hypothetical protein F2Q68_00016992 [Brassica cretica]